MPVIKKSGQGVLIAGCGWLTGWLVGLFYPCMGDGGRGRMLGPYNPSSNCACPWVLLGCSHALLSPLPSSSLPEFFLLPSHPLRLPFLCPDTYIPLLSLPIHFITFAFPLLTPPYLSFSYSRTSIPLHSCLYSTQTILLHHSHYIGIFIIMLVRCLSVAENFTMSVCVCM